MRDALVHIESALKALTLEAYRSGPDGEWTPADHFTIAEELKRVDSAIGPKGESMFARLADSIADAYVELLAARAALEGRKDG